ncbi:MAG: GIY-YIG nuclease family protein [Rhodospirillales bacterium]|nr:GIY-YIG nuclease family protein [Rhodospirillales bacterium]
MLKYEMQGKGPWGSFPPTTLYAAYSKEGGVIKIGVTNNLKSRISRFRSYAEDIRVVIEVEVDDPLSHEYHIHCRLSGAHEREWGREWYPSQHTELRNILAHMNMEASGYAGWLESIIDTWPNIDGYVLGYQTPVALTKAWYR